MSAIALAVPVATGLTLGLLTAVLAQRVRHARARLEALARPLHELRNALAALELGLSFVERSAGSREDLGECADSLRLSLERATLGARDIDALRRGEQIAAGVQDRVDLNALVLRSVRAWSLLAPTYEAGLEVDWRAGPVRVVGDAGRLQQAIDNLFANALEHGGGRVLVESERKGQSVRVLISDGGRGLPQDMDGFLAGNERHTASRTTSSVRGHGLSIAREVIHDHKGRLAFGTGRNGPALLVELPMEDGGATTPASTELRGARSHARQVASKAA